VRAALTGEDKNFVRRLLQLNCPLDRHLKHTS
jgi:hypothetical protein